MKTDIELQIWLAKQLPELIKTDYIPATLWAMAHTSFIWLDGINDGMIVLPREWRSIVEDVEKTLNYDESLMYVSRLEAELRLFARKPTQEQRLKFELISATWQQRATALMMVKGETA